MVAQRVLEWCHSLLCLCPGEYQSTPHRVINLDPGKSRVSAPFFYEPNFEAVVQPIDTLRGSRLVRTHAVTTWCYATARDDTLYTDYR